MICSKCGRFNLSDSTRCSYCGAELRYNNDIVELKSFTGNRLNINDKYFSNGVEFDRSKFEKTAEQTKYAGANTADNGQTRKYPSGSRSVVNNVSFEDGFEMDDMTFLDYNKGSKETVFSGNEKAALRNTALLAVILAILIDAVLVVCMLVYFKGFAERIVNVDYEVSEKYDDMNTNDTIKVNGKSVIV